ncbi:cytochrome b/b6 domain-containing protein [Pacificoceanicola onchidii]|uniref:cytochrome b/b6 domain-containing protein n=1 Tax=Pacificoceanicola onchidii TaxID=2562685 RepID=UPI0010A6B46D|nr:cytochrome b/b6 domain-containing protein [Pacificoceanicola onchidii]
MSLSNTATSFGPFSKFLHWSVALGIIALIPLGGIANGAPFDTPDALAWKAQLFSIHKTLGVGVFFLALIRIVWALSQPKPVPLHPENRLETLLAEVVHWMLYGALVLVPLSGWIHHAATTGFAPIWWPFGQGLPFVPKDPGVAEVFGKMHVIFKNVLIVSLLLHIAGALKHHVIDRDATLRRMLPGRTEAGTPGQSGGHGFAALAALALWGAAIGLSLLPGGGHGPAGAAPAALEQTQSDWTVQDGTLGISVSQMGSAVEGRFGEWQAAIRFDETITEGAMGDVTVDVAIGSLSLGSVTSQALGAEYFDAGRFPTAQYSGEIFAVDGGFELRGALTLRDITVPLVLDFELTLDGDIATVSGEGSLDRRDFAIGESMTDPGQLGFDVSVEFSLVADRSIEAAGGS